jgi:nifR3 family TIM-barrel protein
MKPYLGFLERLEKPFFVLAPMDDVTDAAFRRTIARYGKPDVTWTEFVSADGLMHPVGRKAILPKLWFDESERPIVAQLFSAFPEKMRGAAKLAAELGFDGIDINMGCPDKLINKQGAGAACILDFKKAQDLIRAAQEGARDAGKDLPVSVKTRLGFDTDILESWLPALLEAEPAVVTIHARTRKEMSDVPARWERVGRAVEIAKGSGTLIIGNGDVRDIARARELAVKTGADGVMLGRAIFGNPWLFDEAKGTVSVEEKLRVMVEHTKLYEELFSGVKGFDSMRKHYVAYVSGFPRAKELRVRLMSAKNAAEVTKEVESFLSHEKSY